MTGPDPAPRVCPNCGEPYIADTIDIPKLRLVERTEDAWGITEEYVSTDAAVPVPELHRPCRNVSDWSSADR